MFWLRNKKNEIFLYALFTKVLHSFALYFQPTGRPKPALPAAPNFSPKPSPRGSPRVSPRGSPSGTASKSKENLHDTSFGSSIVSVTPRTLNGSSWITQTPMAMEYSLMTGGAYSRPKPVLQSYEVSVVVFFFQNYKLQIDLYTVKLVSSGHSKPVFSEHFFQNECIKQVKSISAIPPTFIKLPFVIRIFVLSIFEWLLKTVLL